MSLISKGSRSAGHSRWHWGLYNSNMAARGLVAQLKGLCTLMVCVDPPPANQTHQASSTAAAAPPHLPADLDVPRFDRAGRRSVTGNQTCDSETHSFSYHGQVRVEIPSHPKNAEPFCSATVHLPLWDTHTHTHTDDSLFDYVLVCVCVWTRTHISLAAATFIKTEREILTRVPLTQPAYYQWITADPVYFRCLWHIPAAFRHIITDSTCPGVFIIKAL